MKHQKNACQIKSPTSGTHLAEQAKAGRRLNVGCGQWPLLYWTNLDAAKDAHADIYATVPPIPYPDGSLDEIYAGHFLEHLSEQDATAFLKECHRCLIPSGKLGIVVPDTREIMRRYLREDHDRIEVPRGRYHYMDDLDSICRVFLYSTIQDSPHLWSYDHVTLARKLTQAGFEIVGEIDRWNDPRLGTGQWFQFGYDSVKV